MRRAPSTPSTLVLAIGALAGCASSSPLAVDSQVGADAGVSDVAVAWDVRLDAAPRCDDNLKKE